MGHPARLANLDGRAIIITDTGVIDLAKTSGGRLPSDTDHLIARLDEVQTWYDAQQPQPDRAIAAADLLADVSRLGPPVAAPRQIFAVGLSPLSVTHDYLSDPAS